MKQKVNTPSKTMKKSNYFFVTLISSTLYLYQLFLNKQCYIIPISFVYLNDHFPSLIISSKFKSVFYKSKLILVNSKMPNWIKRP